MRIRLGTVAARAPGAGAIARAALGLALGGLCRLAAAQEEAMDAADRRLFADALYARGMHEQAMREYAALAADTAIPERDLVLFRLGESCRRLKRNTDAEKAYARLVNDFPESAFRAQAQVQRALLAAEDNRFKEAAALLLPFADDPKLPADVAPALLQTLANALERTGDVAGALLRQDQIRARFPDSDFAAPAAIRQAYTLAQSAKPEERARAAAICREAVTLARTPRVAAEALFQLGQLLAAEGEAKGAAAAFDELRRKHPDDPRARDAARPAAWACHDSGAHEAALSWIPADGGRDGEREAFLYIRANCERQLGRLEAAAASYQAFVRDYPASPRLRHARQEWILTLFRLGRHADVLAAADGFDPGAEQAADLLWMQAESAAALQQADRAVAFYRKLGEGHPRHALAADAWIRIGWLLQEGREWAGAAAAFTRVAEGAPKHVQAARALLAAGVCLARSGDSEGALASWKKLEADYPEYEALDEALFQTAMEWVRLERADEAVAAFDRLIAGHAASKRRAEGFFWRGVLRRQRDEDDGAIADFRAAVEAAPAADLAREARLELGKLLLKREDAPGAAAVLQPILDDDAARDAVPSDRLAWLSEFQFSRGAFAEAERAARALAGRDQGAAWAQTGWALLGRALRAQNKRDEAIEAYTRAAGIEADTRHLPETLLRLGEMLADAGRLDDAEKRLREAVAKTAAPEWQGLRAHAYAGLGRCSEARGQSEAALRYYLSVALLFDDAGLVPLALDKAAALHAALGRHAESEAVGRELIQRYPESAQGKAWRARLAAGGAGGEGRP